MPDAGWPIFAQWAAEDAARKAQPGYGGNKIPRAYLDRFNAGTDAWLKRIGARPVDAIGDDVPAAVANFARFL